MTLLGSAVLLAACSKKEPSVSAPVELTPEQRMARLAAGEEWILRQTPLLKKMAESAKNLACPGEESLGLFEETLSWTPLASQTKRLTDCPSLPFVKRSDWAPAEGKANTTPAKEAKLLQAAFEGMAGLEKAKFYIESGEFQDALQSKFLAHMGFEGLGKTSAGGWRSFRGDFEVLWRQTALEWRIAEWRPRSFVTSESPQRFFEEKLQAALPDAAAFQRARESIMEQNIVKLFTTGKFQTTHKLLARYQDLESSYQHPGLAVVDIDSDGWDDLYVMDRFGRNQLLRNQGNGTFQDIAPQLGLDLDSFCTSAIFADFDNDGDPDVFIGRSLERTLYMENEQGRFVGRSQKVAAPLPYFVSAISAADYNGDGLLDVYLGLYGPTAQETPIEQWAKEFFPPGMAQELIRRFPASHRYLDRLGPPNLLLRNEGGKFVLPPEAATLAEWRNTYQSTWCDYDADGRPDLYVCNDFAPDALYHNEGPGPNGLHQFREVSREVAGTAMTGFGMGASWADYDHDGRLDLYVSNMFSKAGRRITAQIAGLDQRIPYSAQGSLLFHNEGQKFRQVAGLEPNTVQVARVGWSFGGQFFDADNDTYADIYSSSGYYTAPDVTRSDQDL